MTRQGRYPAEVRERAVRMVFERQQEHPSQWAAITSIAETFGVSHETARLWGGHRDRRRFAIRGAERPDEAGGSSRWARAAAPWQRRSSASTRPS